MLTPDVVFQCPACKELFLSQEDWDKHAERSADGPKIVANWRKEAEAFVGSTVDLVVRSRYPQSADSNVDLGIKKVKVLSVVEQSIVCVDSLKHPDVVIDTELLDLGGDGEYGYHLFATNEISAHAIEFKEWEPTGKDSSWLDKDMKAWMDSGLSASEFLKSQRW